MNTLLSVAALLLTIMLMQMGMGALGPLDTLSAIELQFTNIQIGLIGASHFAGFILGCFGAPALLRRVGHARTYIVAAACSILTILMHPIFPIFWGLVSIQNSCWLLSCNIIYCNRELAKCKTNDAE